MSDVLSAARRLAETRLTYSDNFEHTLCLFCGTHMCTPSNSQCDATGLPEPHDADCPVPMIPQIVAALEMQPYLLKVAYAAKSVIVCGFRMMLEYDPAEGEGVKAVKKQLFAAMQELDDFADAQRAALAGSKEPGGE